MLSLAMRSVRQRPGRFVGTLMAATLGAAITMMFNSLHDTAGAVGVDDASSETLTLTGGVVGGYGSLLVFFAIASTLTINVRQRQEELHLLRCSGATPAQIKRMVMVEALAVAVVGALLAVLPAMLGGRLLLEMFKDTDQVAGGVDYAFGPIALGSGFGITLIASMGAAFLAVRRATRAADGGRAPRGRARTIGGLLALVAGAGGASTTFAMPSDDPALMAPAAYGAILLSIGFAALSPGLLRMLLTVFGRPVSLIGGAGGYLAVTNIRRRADQLAGVLMPLICFTGIGIATLYIQAVESSALDASGLTRSVDDKNVETVNMVVVGIIVIFSCIMLINSLYAAVSYRRAEFGRQRLIGATPAQVQKMVVVEALVLAGMGVFFGTLAGLAGIVPFTVARTDQTLPDEGLGIWLGIVGIAAAATLVTSLVTARRALRVPAIESVAVAA
ncbi:ABC transporter permease [Streptomyces radicis]|uniref:ABC transporter permease n=1 Tax=Streptomyces radicis TaxID=1750517 RepID=A0A3A9WD93_9ACTN|nr:ABC transporter permease [Streptomyces radicis]RKN10263.1 ABC transporter permease [Streptomyces radicis]RKN24604.1 ABC transporter permease [Streptomyces radicis]